MQKNGGKNKEFRFRIGLLIVCTPGEVVHIGDSYDTDVVGTRSAEIRPVLLLWGYARQHDDVDVEDGLAQALKLVFPKD